MVLQAPRICNQRSHFACFDLDLGKLGSSHLNLRCWILFLLRAHLFSGMYRSTRAWSSSIYLSLQNKNTDKMLFVHIIKMERQSKLWKRLHNLPETVTKYVGTTRSLKWKARGTLFAMVLMKAAWAKNCVVKTFGRHATATKVTDKPDKHGHAAITTNLHYLPISLYNAILQSSNDEQLDTFSPVSTWLQQQGSK